MNTPSHAIINWCLLGNKKSLRLVWAILLGSVLPDLPIFGFYFLQKVILGNPDALIWSEIYFQGHWQDLFDLTHSVPIALVGFGAAYYFKSPAGKVFALSFLLHSALDFPVHHDDAHRHFYPFSHFKFFSPVSYWDPKHYGYVGASIEGLMVLASTICLYRRSSSFKARALFALLFVTYLGTMASVYYYFMSE